MVKRMKARIADAARQQSANQLRLKQNLESLRTTIDMALAIDEQLQIEIEKANTLRQQISDRIERYQAARPSQRLVP